MQVGGSDSGGRTGDSELRALGWCFAALCRWECLIWVVGGEIGNFVPWGGVPLHGTLGGPCTVKFI